MNALAPTDPYQGHRFPPEIIARGGWLYFRSCLSYRGVEELLFARGVMVSYEAIRKWWREVGPAGAYQLRHRRPQPGDTWHLDAVLLAVRGERHDLGRAVDQGGNGLDILGQRRRDKDAAKTSFRKLLTGLRCVPRGLITDTLARDGAAKRELLPRVEHRQHRYLNHRAENSHQPTRRRERTRRRFKSAGHAQRSLAAYGPVASHCRPRRHRLRARNYREAMLQRFQRWREITGTSVAA